MNSKRLLKSPWFFILIAAILGLVLPSLLSGGDGYTSVKTSVALAQLQDGNVKSATIKDKEQLLELTLNNGIDPTGDGKQKVSKIETSYPADASQAIFDKVSAAAGANQGQGSSGTGFDTKVTKDASWASLLISLYRSPCCCFWFLFH